MLRFLLLMTQPNFWESVANIDIAEEVMGNAASQATQAADAAAEIFSQLSKYGNRFCEDKRSPLNVLMIDGSINSRSSKLVCVSIRTQINHSQWHKNLK